MVYKVKRHWWMWALGILFNALAIRFAISHASFLLFLMLFFDIFVILPDWHLYYILEYQTLIVHRALFSHIKIPFKDITMLEKSTALTFGGFGVYIGENSLISYKITYTKDGRRKVAIISPKDPQFIKEFTSHLDEQIIMFNNTDTAFKNKKIKNDSNKK